MPLGLPNQEATGHWKFMWRVMQKYEVGQKVRWGVSIR